MVRSDPSSRQPSRVSRWEDLFDELVEPPAPERAGRLAELRAEDGELAERVERLLAADGAATGFLDRSTLDLLGTSREAEETDLEPQLPAGTTVGAWRVVSLLGRGGMGEVYLADRTDPAFAQRVALKVIKRGMDSQAIVRRFVRERQILARLDHPNLAHLLDGGTGPHGSPSFPLPSLATHPTTAR